MPFRCRARISSCGESGFSAGELQQLPELGGQGLEFGRPLALRRPGTEVVREDLLVQLLPPGHAGVLHFGGDHGAGGLGREQQLEPLLRLSAGRPSASGAGHARLAERVLLGGVLVAQLLRAICQGAVAQAGVVEQCALLGRRGRRLQGPRRLLQVIVLG